ncbi:Epoxide hydrolase 4 [Mortierella antarctica]|nr:Epoxide hydrolase 4 [Mortierella antarctica]
MDLKEYGMRNICNQLAGVLDALNIPKVTILGHDWGGALAWRFGLYYPNRLHGIISVCTPFIPPKTTFRTLEEIVQAEPKFEYQLKYANPASTAGMDATDRKYVISEYKHSGFRGPLNYYKTTCVNFEDEIGLHRSIDLPCWIILAYDDPFLPIRLVYEMANYLPKLKTATIWARHFVISEKPNETNVLLKQCLDDLLLRRN